MYFDENSFVLVENCKIKKLLNLNEKDLIIGSDGNLKQILRLNKLRVEHIYKININNNYPIFSLDQLSGKFYSKIRVNHTNNLNENKCRLLGLYAAEGSFHDRAHKKNENLVIFTFGENEKNTLASLCIELLNKEFNCKAYCKIYGSRCTVFAYQKNISAFFRKHIGTYSLDKSISEELLNSTIECKKQFILGWLEGDGSIDKYSHKLIGTTISPNLSHQIRYMLYSMGIHNSLYIESPNSSKLKCGRTIVGKHEVFRLKINYSNSLQLIKNSPKLFLPTKTIRNINKFNENNKCIHNILSCELLNKPSNLISIEVDGDYLINNMIFNE